MIVEILEESELRAVQPAYSRRGLFISQTSTSLLDAAIRLAQLLETPEDIKALAPMYIREILYRILKGQQGDVLKQIAVEGSSAYRIKEVIEQIKENYAQPLRIEELAELANMSPLQYQKNQIAGSVSPAVIRNC
ncbi:AraC family transcriptional regulator [Paenibacillus polymyxa]|uniref:AraC family transcriptional regulator n=1 Tax=Paenibacillus polymyxa TaxID=1406 RepID=UPI0033905462